MHDHIDEAVLRDMLEMETPGAREPGAPGWAHLEEYDWSWDELYAAFGATPSGVLKPVSGGRCPVITGMDDRNPGDVYES